MTAMQTLTQNVLDNNTAWSGLTVLDQTAACIELVKKHQEVCR
jgi:hypothetical protein